MGEIRKRLSQQKIDQQTQVFQSWLVHQKPDLLHDPIQFPHHYTKPVDIEIVAWISSILSFGRVESIKGFLNQCTSHWGKTPYDYFISQSYQKDPWDKLVYRWIKGTDLLILFETTRALLLQYKSLGHHAQSLWQETQPNLQSFMVCYANDWRARLQERGRSTRGVSFLVPNPHPQSTMKRLWMFLRWMANDGYPDFGLWDFLPKNQLNIALDTHMFQFAHQFGWTSSKVPNARVVQEVSQMLSLLEPKNPLDLDFYLTQMGIRQQCLHRYVDKKCQVCQLSKICKLSSPKKVPNT